MPEAEFWTFNASLAGDDLRERMGINLGAPGDRRDDSGTLWLEFPAVGGPGPKTDIAVEPAEVEWFRSHSSLVAGDGFDWVAASGGQGIRSLVVKVGNDKPRPYTVRLHFAEPESRQPGERRFSIALQGRTVLEGLDVVKEASGPNRGLIREFRGIEIGGELRIELTPASNRQATLLSGVELIAESPPQP
jgi:hypothetical protein